MHHKDTQMWVYSTECWCVYVLFLPLSCTLAALLVLWRLRPFVAPSSHFQPRLANREGHFFWTVSTTPLSNPLLSPTTNLPSFSLWSVFCGTVQGLHAGVEHPPSSFKGEKVPETELLIQSGERYAQLSIHKGPGWVRGPCRGQAVQSPGGINCGWQCVNSGVNRQRRCETLQSILNSPFHPCGSLLALSLLFSRYVKIAHISD